MTGAHLIRPAERVSLKDIDPDSTGGYSEANARKKTHADIERLVELQHLLYAENRRSLLVVLQAMDAGGKDGTIRHVMSGVNPQGCQVTAFKVPSEEELDHDFLWRVHKAVPRKGNIGIFNRSHYEDVLAVRVHKLVPKTVWRARYRQINAFERLLVAGGMVILKFFLHISKAEQKRRLEERLSDPKKNWKFSLRDVEERKLWDQYQRAYDDALSRCSTAWAPWCVVPANRKWYRNLVVADRIVQTLEGLKMQYPKPTADLAKIRID